MELSHIFKTRLSSRIGRPQISAQEWSFCVECPQILVYRLPRTTQKTKHNKKQKILNVIVHPFPAKQKGVIVEGVLLRVFSLHAPQFAMTARP